MSIENPGSCKNEIEHVELSTLVPAVALGLPLSACSEPCMSTPTRIHSCEKKTCMQITNNNVLALWRATVNDKRCVHARNIEKTTTTARGTS